MRKAFAASLAFAVIAVGICMSFARGAPQAEQAQVYQTYTASDQVAPEPVVTVDLSESEKNLIEQRVSLCSTPTFGSSNTMASRRLSPMVDKRSPTRVTKETFHYDTAGGKTANLRT